MDLIPRVGIFAQVPQTRLPGMGLLEPGAGWVDRKSVV